MRKQQFWLIIFFAFLLIFMLNFLNEKNTYSQPLYDKVDIVKILEKDEFSEKDFEILYQQTGLGKLAIVDIKKDSPDFKKDMLSYQEQMMNTIYYKSEFIFPTTKEDILINKDGKQRVLKLAPIRNGDVIVTKGTHTLTWRHGHAAIIINADTEDTLESVLIGINSSYQTLERWRSYPTFMILRPKDTDYETMNQIAKYAKKELWDIPYNPFVGIKAKDKSSKSKIDSTQCAHLVWQAYKAFGIDLDSDGGWLVTPKDIANSNQLEVVQVFGFDIYHRWK